MNDETNHLLEQILKQLKTNNDTFVEYMEQGIWKLEDRLTAVEDALQDVIHAVESLEK